MCWEPNGTSSQEERWSGAQGWHDSRRAWTVPVSQLSAPAGRSHAHTLLVGGATVAGSADAAIVDAARAAQAALHSALLAHAGRAQTVTQPAGAAALVILAPQAPIVAVMALLGRVACRAWGQGWQSATTVLLASPNLSVVASSPMAHWHPAGRPDPNSSRAGQAPHHTHAWGHRSSCRR